MVEGNTGEGEKEANLKDLHGVNDTDEQVVGEILEFYHYYIYLLMVIMKLKC